MILDLFLYPIHIWSVTTGTPLGKLFGENFCWLYNILFFSRGSKMFFGSFFMAMYRIICMKRPTMKMSRQKQIVNQLLLLECIVSVFFGGLFVTGTAIRDDLKLKFTKEIIWIRRSCESKIVKYIPSYI